MRLAFRRSAFALSCGCLVTAGAVGSRAEPIPLPNLDYSVKAKMIGGMTMTSRHSQGKMRMDMNAPGVPLPMTTYIDLKTRKIITVMSVPGMSNMAVEADLGEEETPGVAVGEGRRAGSATVAGEPCDLWQIEGKSKMEKSANAIVCISRDSIPLQLQATVDGKRETIFEVTEITRGPQDVKALTPPANLKPMEIPKGLIPSRK